jgi:hypothetical protein
VYVGSLVVPTALFYEKASGQLDVPLEDVGDSNSNNDQALTTGDNITDSSLELLAIKAQLKPHENNFLADDGYYQIKKFGSRTSNGSSICPSNSCKYGVEEGQFYTISGNYVFEGRLKVTTAEDGTKKTQFYNFRSDLEKSSEVELGGDVTLFLEGDFALGKNVFSPDMKFDITNATLAGGEKNPILTLQGERSPL